MGENNVGEIIVNTLKLHKKAMTQKELIEAVLVAQGIKATEKNKQKKQPTVSKALKTRINQKSVFKTPEGSYILYSDDCEKEILKKQIEQTVVFTKASVFPVSDTTLLVGVETSCISEAKELLKAYLGDERCFDIMFINGYLAILLCISTPEEAKDIQEKLQEIAAASIKHHNKSRRKALKLINTAKE